MSDETKGLIAEARRSEAFARANRYGQQSHADLISRLADALEAATRERDAATEARIERWMQLVGKGVEERMTAEAERDAAVAALERVRAAVSGHPECDRYEEGDVISCGWKSAYASVVAALDGAPEPEHPETGNERRDDDGDLVTSGAHLKVLHQGGYVCDTCINILGLNVRWDHAVLRETHTPLPVEGEKP